MHLELAAIEVEYQAIAPPQEQLMMSRPLSIHYTTGQCSLGTVLYGVCDAGICAILPGDDEAVLVEDLTRRYPVANIERYEALRPELDALLAYVDHPAAASPPLQRPLAAFGTEFQRQVWDALSKVAAGQTISYSELATRCGRPGAMRAVAGACAANPLAIIVPCHRVLRSDGGISGYRWGVERKRSLIDLEKHLATEV